ncbi:hypothetical protein [Acidovorax sp.]|uniref:hypothetical protein n=1 Tax=Acidovorax sp. TaxID=1872122 RepID=UPI003D05B12A
MISSISDLLNLLVHAPPPVSPYLAESAPPIPGDLPEGLASVYAVGVRLGWFGAGLTPYGTQDKLLHPSRLKRVEGMIEFAWENQGNWSCRFPARDNDPQVFSNASDSWTGLRQGFRATGISLNHFLITFCLQELVCSCPQLLVLPEDIGQERLKALGFKPLWLSGRDVDDEPTHDFYGWEDGRAFLFRHCHEGLFVGSAVVSGVVARLHQAGVGTVAMRTS